MKICKYMENQDAKGGECLLNIDSNGNKCKEEQIIDDHDPKTGAHFIYKDVYNRLLKLKESDYNAMCSNALNLKNETTSINKIDYKGLFKTSDRRLSLKNKFKGNKSLINLPRKSIGIKTNTNKNKGKNNSMVYVNSIERTKQPVALKSKHTSTLKSNKIISKKTIKQCISLLKKTKDDKSKIIVLNKKKSLKTRIVNHEIKLLQTTNIM